MRSNRLPIAGIALAMPFLVWFAIGDLSFRQEGSLDDFHDFGPYDVGPQPGYVIAGLAAVVALVAIGVLVRRTRRRGVDRRSWAVVAALVGAGALGAAGWRICTAGVVGANIGAGLVMLTFPVLIAALLVAAVWLAGGGRQSRRRSWLLTIAAVLVAPALYALLYALIR